MINFFWPKYIGFFNDLTQSVWMIVKKSKEYDMKVLYLWNIVTNFFDRLQFLIMMQVFI